MDLGFVTSNPDKVREVRAILAPFGVRVTWVRRSLPEPQADDLADVVRAKLRAAPPAAGPVLVEDSGLFLPALGGFPGVYSAYVYRTLGLAGVLRALQGKDRAAVFETVAGVRRGGSIWLARGRTRGTIAARPRGRNGFGYDPIFVPAGATETFAEMTDAGKNALSHRGRAIRAVGRRLAHPA